MAALGRSTRDGSAQISGRVENCVARPVPKTFARHWPANGASVGGFHNYGLGQYANLRTDRFRFSVHRSEAEPVGRIERSVESMEAALARDLFITSLFVARPEMLRKGNPSTFRQQMSRYKQFD